MSGPTAGAGHCALFVGSLNFRGPVLSKPDISDDIVVSCVEDAFGLRISEATFRPSGDANSAVYRVTTDDRTRYFLKLRGGDFDEVAATVPAYLYSRGFL